jgi:exosome complex exonuclease RRP6
VDNKNNSPWYPTLSHKYNAQVPLGHNYSDADDDVGTSLHPYQYEIKHITYPDRMFQSSPPIPPKPFEGMPFSWISTVSEFACMLDKLRGAKEIAVDLEHHSYRTWAGFLCLMQISTRVEDFVVDTIALREELQELNEVFTDPGIIKVNISCTCSIY